MKYSILKNIVCNSIHHKNYGGSYPYKGLAFLAEDLLSKSKWDFMEKSNLPAFCCTSFTNRISQEDAEYTKLYALDFDSPLNTKDKVLDVFSDYSYFCYTSYNHSKDHHKFRIILELDYTIKTNNDSHTVFNIINNRMLSNDILLDEKCKDIARRFFMPSKNKDNQMCEIQYNFDGKIYDVSNEVTTVKYKSKSKELEQIERSLWLKEIYKNNPDKNTNRIDNAKLKFLNNPGHDALRTLISTLIRSNVEKYEIINWVVMNYNPSTGSARVEAENWYNWLIKRM